MSRRPTQSLGCCSEKCCSELLTQRVRSCGCSLFHNGITWLAPSTLAFWLFMTSALVKIALLLAVINSRQTRQEKRLATSTCVTTHLIHWFRCFLPWGFASLWNPLVLNTEHLFQEEENDANAASQRCCSQLAELFKGCCDALVKFIGVDHANTHGTRKGSAMKASCGTCARPPPVSSIASHGKWSTSTLFNDSIGRIVLNERFAFRMFFNPALHCLVAALRKDQRASFAHVLI